MNAIAVFPAVLDRILKWALFLLAGIVLTFLLLMLMAKLVEFNGEPPIEDPGRIVPVAIFDVPPQVQEQITKLEPPAEVVPPPVSPSHVVPTTDPSRSDLNVIPDFIATVKNDDNPAIDFDSGAPVKRVSASPIYPRRALSRGVEGYVDVRYFVSPAGFTESASIVYSQPNGYFEKSALQAVERWKFQPREKVGAESYGPIVERIRFSIAQ